MSSTPDTGEDMSEMSPPPENVDADQAKRRKSVGQIVIGVLALLFILYLMKQKS